MIRYTNIDIEGTSVRYCTEKEIKRNITILDKYFTRPFGTPRGSIIVDRKMDLLKKWDYKTNSVEEIVMISVFEHFSKQEAFHIVNEIKRVLQHGGKLIVDFPDIKKDISLYYDKNPEFLMELIYCNHKNKYSVHHWGYTPSTFRKLWGNGFIVEQKTIVKHAYPTIGMVVTKL